MDKCQSYAITLRPRDGVCEEHITRMMKWVRKACLYYHVVTEKTGSDRHIHAALFLRSPASRSNVVTHVTRMFDDLSTEEKRVLRNGIKIMYNGDFIKNYLDKEDDTVVVSSSLPEAACMDSYFPPKPPAKVSSIKKCSLYYHELEKLWYMYNTPATEVNTQTTRNFLFRVMYKERVISVIRDDKQIIQVSRHLTRWLNKSDFSTIELPPFEKEE